jgi:hypothetical protein
MTEAVLWRETERVDGASLLTARLGSVISERSFSQAAAQKLSTTQNQTLPAG